jgi:peptidoglycan/xylan/chitin deacetylase (PgdA/CDA1 family)
MRKFLLCFVIIIPVIINNCMSISEAVPEINKAQKKVILSFDDGPNADRDTTIRLLDVLKKHNIRATFALLGVNVEKNPDLAKRIYEEGHVIINHGYSDKWASKMNNEQFRENLIKGEAAIVAALGEKPYPRLYRPHGGFYYKRHERIWREEGWTLSGVNIRVYDAVINEKGKQKLVKKVINKTVKRGGGTILLHDARDSHYKMETQIAKNSSFNRSWIPDVVEEIIIALLERGFSFDVE